MTEERSNQPNVRQQLCTKCGTEYDANYISFPMSTPSARGTARLFQPFQAGELKDMSGGMCPECREVLAKEREKEEETERLAEVAADRRAMRERCGIELKFMHEDFSTFDTDRAGNIKVAHAECFKYAEGFPIRYLKHIREDGKAYRSLLLFSTDVWGIGKTHLACAIGHRILDRWNGEKTGCPIKFVSEPDLIRDLQATFDYTREEKEYLPSSDKIMEQLIVVPLLILDDVGKVPVRDPRFVQRTLFSIINGRYNKLRPIVLTTNKSQTELRDYLGNSGEEASFDRLFEMTAGRFIRLKGESYRRKED